jgi:TetR/AcrR family transcriptional repressor of nem operon
MSVVVYATTSAVVNLFHFFNSRCLCKMKLSGAWNNRLATLTRSYWKTLALLDQLVYFDFAMSELPTKERIIEAAEKLMLEKSFHSVGLNEILKAANVPKGSFYHHFGSKEQFGVELINYYSASANASKRRLLLSSELEANPRARLLTFFESGVACFVENGGKCPCLIVKLASEVANFSEAMREAMEEARTGEWVKITEQLLREGIEKKAIARLDDPMGSARLIDILWMGALLEAIVTRKVTPLRLAIDHIAKTLAPVS